MIPFALGKIPLAVEGMNSWRRPDWMRENRGRTVSDEEGGGGCFLQEPSLDW